MSKFTYNWRGRNNRQDEDFLDDLPGYVYIIRDRNKGGLKVGYTTSDIEVRIQQYLDDDRYTVAVDPELCYCESAYKSRANERLLQYYFQCRGCFVGETGWIHGNLREHVLRELILTT